MIASASRVEQFNAAHRLHNPDWSDEKNELFYGLCNNPNYHGHNYKLIVKITGEVDSESGYLIDLKVLKNIIRNEVTDKFDHRNLNLDVPEFKDLIPTAENIAYVIWHKINNQLKDNLNLHITLYETERNFIEYDGK
jgi:6-pyruvoyltetrahydropterin/6-carboxytetrahydropterin synthase|tara:strand:- start:3094 stop:3504 length:411 start_codon:yes stop_codon:yes gene_type:complete